MILVSAEFLVGNGRKILLVLLLTNVVLVCSISELHLTTEIMIELFPYKMVAI